MSKRWISICTFVAVPFAWGCSSKPNTLPPAATTTSAVTAATTSSTAHSPAGGCPSDAVREQELGLGDRTASIQMVSAQRGFAVVARTVVGTVDAQHWNQLYRASEDLSYIDAVDSMHVWAVGTHSLFVSTDGGGHWTAIATPAPFHLVHFVNPALGWAVADGSLLASFDGGRSWQNASAPCPVDRVCFADSLHGWVASRTSAYVTTDGGAHWSRRLAVQDPNFANAAVLDMQCTPTNAAWILFDSNNHAAGSDGYAAYRCPPSGACRVVEQNFLAAAPPNTSGPGSTPGPFSVIDEHTAAFVGYSGPDDNPTSIMIVGDDGQDRGPVFRVAAGLSGQVPVQGVSFVSADRGWIVDGDSTIGTRILATTDGGKTWTVQYQAPFP
jgi:photosystem II stability/assembly factor-like uncharacterized protein